MSKTVGQPAPALPDDQRAQLKVDVDVVHHRRDAPHATTQPRQIIAEEPLIIDIVSGGSYTIMRTPGDDLHLALGFLFAEGLIDGADDVLAAHSTCERSNTLVVELKTPDQDAAQRNLVVSSSCGLCGRAGIDALVGGLEQVDSELRVSAETLFAMPARFRATQPLFAATGGCHGAALFDVEGSIRHSAEDLGRHSALDKAIGAALASGATLSDLGIFLSGRSSLEMIVKAARAKIGIVVAVSAPSSAAVSTAEGLGITLCGFARGEEFAVYSHAHRISASRDDQPLRPKP